MQNQPLVQPKPYSLPLFRSKRIIPGQPLTPELYIHRFIDGQRCTCIFGISQLIFSLCCLCETSTAQNALLERNYAKLESSLRCINVWNGVMFVFCLLSIFQNTVLLVQIDNPVVLGVICGCLFNLYLILCCVMFYSQMNSYNKQVRMLLPQVAQRIANGGFVPAIQGVIPTGGQPIGGQYFSPSNGGYQAPQPGYQAPSPQVQYGKQHPIPNNANFQNQTPFD